MLRVVFTQLQASLTLCAVVRIPAMITVPTSVAGALAVLEELHQEGGLAEEASLGRNRNRNLTRTLIVLWQPSLL